jgi:hypothetical protein
LEGEVVAARDDRARAWLIGVVLVALLGACETGSTEVTGGGTGPTETAPTGPTETAPTGTTAATGPTAAGVIEGSWSGTWGIEGFPDAGTFSLEIEPAAGGFEGAIQIQNSECVSGGAVEIGLDGDRITFGVVQAEQEISFTGTVSGDRMSGTWNDGGGCPPPHDGIWEAVRS